MNQTDIKQLFNNYGPKRNDELLLGYGFCIPNNPHEKILMTLKPPPEELQGDLRRVHSGYFNTDGEWSSEKATFAIGQIPGDLRKPEDIFEHFPEPLLEVCDSASLIVLDPITNTFSAPPLHASP